MSKNIAHKDYMLVAIKEAKRSTQPIRCGCVIVKNDLILASAHNSQRLDSDSTAHAEISALRLAGKKFGRETLKQATVYCTCEPCLMCLSALSIASISKLYFAVQLDKLARKENLITISTQEFLRNTPWKFTVVANFMQAECQAELYNINT